MVDRSTKLRWRRRIKRSQHKVENLSVRAEKGVEELFFARLPRLGNVRRFVLGWIMLVLLLGAGVIAQVRALSPYYETLQPVKGGIYTEGIIGRFTTANPLYATGSVDSSVSKLVFSGLMKYNSQNQLVGDLAKEVKSDDRGVVYTVTLKDDIYWHDGKPVTPDDIIFTYRLIQNPDAKSSLYANWKNIKIEKVDDKTIKFTLPHALASFKQSLVSGIVPKHKLEKVAPSQLRTAEFNTVTPVGSGPFKWDSIQISGQSPESREEQIGLSANEKFYDGTPNLDKFIVKAIHTRDSLIGQFNNQQVDAMVGINKRPENIGNDTSINEFDVPMNAQAMVFFKTTNEVLKDKIVRQALTKATNRADIVSGLGYPVASTQGPLLPTHVGYAPDVLQQAYNVQEANTLLDQNGWVKGADGIREKAGQKLQFRLYSQNNNEYPHTTQLLQQQWKEIGADVKVVLEEDKELQSTIALHNYDALLYGITVGSDPDVYAYWHSSQADIRASSRLNFSELKSAQIDSALDAGRTRTDPNLRATKYRPFLTTWRDEAPAVALYRPRFLYITRGKVYGLDATTINTATDRYANVQNWRVRTEREIIQ
jgi:peptide/nickel transport system substrate-binding protein